MIFSPLQLLVYIKVSLYVKHKRIRSRRSPLKKPTQEIEFNESFPVHVISSSLRDVDISVTVSGRSMNGLGAKKVLGKAYVGEKCVENEHWQDMSSNPNSIVNHWYKLS